MGTPRQRLRLGQDVGGPEDVPGALFLTRALEAGLPQVRTEGWQTSATSVPEPGEVVVRVRASDSETVLYERAGTLVEVTLMPGFASVAVAGRASEEVDETVEWLRARLPAPDPSSRHEVQVTFWTYSPRGPMPAWRSIAVPGWDEIRRNYAAVTHAGLAPLMAGFEPTRGGQLVLWHGKAGTGKTYALRALAWEWRRWCEFHYIVDPDLFFGEHADYLMNVLLQPSLPDFDADGELDDGDFGIGVDIASTGSSFTSFGLPGGDARPRKAWKLLMLEDTGELLTPDARSLIGQGLSRFLNVVDGLIGQGLRVLVLVTTNEEIRRLHPAVARPGRCAANVEFVPLLPEEANAWLEERGSDERVSRPTTLASLYALAEGGDADEREVGAGFGG